MQPRVFPRALTWNALRCPARNVQTASVQVVPRSIYFPLPGHVNSSWANYQQVAMLHHVRRQLLPVTKDDIKLTENEHLPEYSPSKVGIISMIPKSWVPYAELIRIDKPTGTYYLFFPCLFSSLMAAPMADPMASFSSVAGTTVLFFTGALIMRGAGCTINDLWDRNLDPHVRRTRLRPIARGAITPFQGIMFTGAQLLVGLSILLQFPLPCLFYGVPSLLFVACYPLAKRVTHYPQFILGLTFSWGAFMGFPAYNIDLFSNSSALTAAACLYASNIAWTVLYDMIYAHMDIKDDIKVGIKSIALKHDKQTKKVLSGLAITQVSLLCAAGVAAGAGPVFFLGSCGGALVTLGVMIKRVNLKSVKDCWWWFVNGCWVTGSVISLGLVADYIARAVKQRRGNGPRGYIVEKGVSHP